MRPRVETLLALLAVTAATGFLFAPLAEGALTGEARFLEWDVPEQYWPDLVFLCEALGEGELPLWNPHDRGGYPSYADPQAGTYHPLNWALCAVGGSSPSLALAELRVVLGFFLAGVFGWLWLRRLGLPTGPALLGAVVIEAAPFMRHNWELNLTTALAYLPLMLWAAERAATERRARDGALLGLAAALCAWVGSPPALWFAAAFAAPYFLVRWLGEARREGRETLIRGGVAALVAAAFAAGFSLVVLLPGAQLAGHSVQAGRDFVSIAAGGLEPQALLALVSPRPGNHLYVGLVALALAPLAFLGRGEALPGRWFHLVMALAAVLLALGANAPFFRLAFEGVPGVALFRLPHRYEAWLGPALGALAASGLARLSAGRLEAWLGPRLPRFGLLAGALLSALLLLDVSRRLPEDRHTRSGPHPASLDRAPAVLARAPETIERFRYFDEFGLACRSGTRLSRRDLRGYQDPLQLKAYERVVASLREHPRLVEQYNVRFLLTGPHFIHGWQRHYLPPPPELLAIEGALDRGEGVIELPGPLPAAYFVPSSRVARLADRPEVLRRLAPRAPAPVALLDGAVTGPPPAAPLPVVDRLPEGFFSTQDPIVAAQDFTLDRDALSLRITAPEAGVVVVNETWYPGWRARLDGRDVPIYRVNALVRGVAVEAGDHRLEMTFRPKDGDPLRWLLLATWLAFFVLMISGLIPLPLLRGAEKGRTTRGVSV